jgi:colanic acid/amylovoran biosynthesis glycosyltransferase
MIRTWLRPTESFVSNQLRYLQEFEPAVFSHREYKGSTKWSGSHVMTSDLLVSWVGRMDTVAYGLARTMPAPTARAICTYVRDLRPDVIHVHYLVDAAFFAPVLQRLDIPVVVSGYGYDVSRFPRSLFGYGGRYLRRSFGLTSLFTAMSEDMKRDMIRLGFPEAKVHVHYHGVDVQRFACDRRESADAHRLRILIVGRLVPKKGHAILLRALQLLGDSWQVERGYELRVVGDGPMRARLARMSRELSLDQHVHFTGHLQYAGEAMLSEYAKADVFVLPSMRVEGNKEGIPGTLLEAMAAGLPIISTFHAGIPEVMEHGTHGLLVPEADAEALARALYRLMEDATLRQRLAAAAAARATEFDVRMQTHRLESLYKTLMARPPEQTF